MNQAELIIQIGSLARTSPRQATVQPIHALTPTGQIRSHMLAILIGRRAGGKRKRAGRHARPFTFSVPAWRPARRPRRKDSSRYNGPGYGRPGPSGPPRAGDGHGNSPAHGKTYFLTHPSDPRHA